ncbi:hypothetical protein NOK12_21540 [Nocardioides sp. OK12]|uniref:DUF6752 domain-containing protein n=1 Tax=Nocardioides marinisabuli TaxID=419476 RepID=A0A7Y9EXW7_9ACTN|nr:MULTISPECIES: DUF6752 domain-containing protein [Nocardioides]NYD55965.1 hypothetical protein [Nocardioides marinisabuli]GHJ59636.1 hypothetical protein NOK12_21540 [Nocardioides sp. OK12]
MKNVLRQYRDQAGLARRVAELEAEVQECRSLNLRVAELTDLVAELLVPLAGSDDPRVVEILERYRAGVSDPAGPSSR